MGKYQTPNIYISRFEGVLKSAIYALHTVHGYLHIQNEQHDELRKYSLPRADLCEP